MANLPVTICVLTLLAVLSAAAVQPKPWVRTPISAAGVLMSTTGTSLCYCTDIPPCALGSTSANTAASNVCSCDNYGCGVAAWAGLSMPSIQTPCQLSCGMCPCCVNNLPTELQNGGLGAGNLFLQALMLTGLIQQASNPAVAATIFVPSDTSITSWLASLGCTSLYHVAAMNRTLLMDVVATHFAPATVLPLKAPLRVSIPTRQGIITAADMAASNITLRTAAWAPSSTSAQSTTAASSNSNTAGAGQNATTDSVASLSTPDTTTAPGMQLALVPTNGSWDITAPSQAAVRTVTYNTSTNATASTPAYLALPPHTMAIVLTRTAQSLTNSTANSTSLSAAVYTAAAASMFESLLYGPGNPVGTGAHIIMNDLSTCRAQLHIIDQVLLPYPVPPGLCAQPDITRRR